MHGCASLVWSNVLPLSNIDAIAWIYHWSYEVHGIVQVYHWCHCFTIVPSVQALSKSTWSVCERICCASLLLCDSLPWRKEECIVSYHWCIEVSVQALSESTWSVCVRESAVQVYYCVRVYHEGRRSVLWATIDALKLSLYLTSLSLPWRYVHCTSLPWRRRSVLWVLWSSWIYNGPSLPEVCVCVCVCVCQSVVEV